MKKAREEVYKVPFEPGLLNQWGGVVPFVAAISAIGITKEIVLIDAEMLLGASMTAVYVGMYLAIGDTVKKTVKGGYDNVVSWFKDGHDAAIAGCGFYKAEQKAKLEAENCWKEYLAEYKEVMTAHAEAMAIKPRHVAREKVVASLEAIRGREKLQSANQWRKFIVAYEAAVRSVLADPELQDELFENALFLIGSEDQEAGIDFQLTLSSVLERALAVVDPELADVDYPGGSVDDPEDAWKLIEEEETPESEQALQDEFKALEAFETDLQAKTAALEAAATPEEDEQAAAALFEILPEEDLLRMLEDSDLDAADSSDSDGEFDSELAALEKEAEEAEEADEDSEGEEAEGEAEEEAPTQSK